VSIGEEVAPSARMLLPQVRGGTHHRRHDLPGLDGDPRVAERPGELRPRMGRRVRYEAEADAAPAQLLHRFGRARDLLPGDREDSVDVEEDARERRAHDATSRVPASHPWYGP